MGGKASYELDRVQCGCFLVPFRVMWLPRKLHISTRTLTLVQQGQLSDLTRCLEHLGGCRIPPSSAGIVQQTSLLARPSLKPTFPDLLCWWCVFYSRAHHLFLCLLPPQPNSTRFCTTTSESEDVRRRLESAILSTESC
eukprot:IDg2928t1